MKPRVEKMQKKQFFSAKSRQRTKHYENIVDVEGLKISFIGACFWDR